MRQLIYHRGLAILRYWLLIIWLFGWKKCNHQSTSDSGFRISVS